MLNKYLYRPVTFDRFFDSFNDDMAFSSKNSRLELESKVEEDGSTSFTMDLPGVKKDDLSVEVEDRVVTITIKAERKTKTSSCSVNKSFTLSDNFDLHSLAANLEDGVLTLNVKQVSQEERKPRKVPIFSSKK